MLQIVVPYLVLVGLIVAAGILMFVHTSEVAIRMAVERNREALDQVRLIMDERFAEVDEIARRVATDPDVNRFRYIARPFDGALTYQILATRNQLYDYTITNPFISAYFAVFERNDLVLGPTLTYELASFYSDVLTYDDLAYGEWRELVLGQFHRRSILPASHVRLYGRDARVLTYLRSLGHQGLYDGAMVMLLNVSEIESVLSAIEFGQAGGVTFFDRSGRPMFSVGPSPPTSSDVDRSADSRAKVVETSVTSAYNGWTIVSAQSRDVVFRQIRGVRTTSLMIATAAVLLGLVAALALAYKDSLPLRRLLAAIQVDVEEPKRPETEKLPRYSRADVFHLIGSRVADLVTSRDELRSEIEEQRPLMRASFFERLLHGRFDTNAEFREILPHIGIDVDGKVLTVAAVHTRRRPGGSTLAEADALRVVVKDIVRSVVGADGLVHDVSEDSIALLLLSDCVNGDECRKHVEDLLSRVSKLAEENAGIKLHIGIGGPCTELLNVWKSYEEARYARDTGNDESEPTLRWYEDVPTRSAAYYFPNEVEARIAGYTIAGDGTRAVELARSVFRRNSTERNLSVTMRRLLTADMCGVVLKSADQLEISDELFGEVSASISSVMEADEYEDAEQRLCETLESLADYARRGKRSHNDVLRQQMLDLVAEEYSDPQLSLTSAADRLGISESYLSHFFKEQTGRNFHVYLEELRMKRACELLKTTSVPVVQIATAVGYSSSNTFGRAFRRVHGMNATTHRRRSRAR